MTRKTYHYDRDLKKMVEGPAPRKCRRKHDYHIMPDLEPYTAMGGEDAGMTISGRKQHREYLKRNGLQEVGNEHSFMTRWGGKTYDNRDRDPGEYDW